MVWMKEILFQFLINKKSATHCLKFNLTWLQSPKIRWFFSTVVGSSSIQTTCCFMLVCVSHFPLIDIVLKRCTFPLDYKQLQKEELNGSFLYSFEVVFALKLSRIRTFFAAESFFQIVSQRFLGHFWTQNGSKKCSSRQFLLFPRVLHPVENT